MTRLAIGITGSFCNHEKILSILERLKNEGYELIPVCSESVFTNDTRFFKAIDFISKVEEICDHRIIHTIVEAEKVLNTYHCDEMIIIPCTANTLNKLASGIYDNPVTLAAKSLLRNDLSIIIALATNDGLSNSLENIGKIIKQKNIYIVPFFQDDYMNKPYSIISDFDLSIDTLRLANLKKQIQPILKR